MPEKHTPSFLRALGKKPLPQQLSVEGQVYRLERVFKHDFFAATALYAGAKDRVVLKVGRKAPVFLLPLGWIGRWHAHHESAAYCKLQDLRIVPRFLGRFGKHGFIHQYIDGHALKKGEHVPDNFFPTLKQDIALIHQRQMAYVDLEKCENVIVGDDGKPYLIDFQIAWNWPAKFGGNLPPLSWIRTWLQRSDIYHLRKLQRRTRPDQLTNDELQESYRKPGYIRLHGAIVRPFTLMRRRILDWLDPGHRGGERGRTV